MPDDDPEIDYVYYPSIRFPSDRVTIADLRRLYSDDFDQEGPALAPVDPLVEAVCAKHGQPLPPPKSDWLLEQLRAMPAHQTIHDLRRMHPHIFDVEDGLIGAEAPKTYYESSNEISEMLFLERGLARVAYQEAYGNPHQSGRWFELPERDGYREDLAEIYIEFGLAGGKHEAREMIRQFEAEAVAQARLGRQPPPPR